MSLIPPTLHLYSDGTYTLRAVTDAGEMEPPPSPFDWQ
ncbi:hypothetical protein SEA_IKELOA_120 [Mycobacterium phage IkeLoa]|nr:hypothetical protein SEA_IKELOA_120 [Mycobacterium phage IkeLoa]